MKIAFVDLPRQTKLYKNSFEAAAARTIKRADFIQGEELTKFESAFAKFCNKKYCIGVNSGTDALLFALIAYGIGPGDEVITAPNSYFSTAMVIEHTGAKVVFADIDPGTHSVDPNEIRKKLSSRTRAIIPIHLYGMPAGMGEIISIARKKNLFIIEDCCQAHGATYQGKRVPITETGAFSFYPGKNLGCFGDGGALVTDNKSVAEKTLLLRNDGSRIKYTHLLFGYKSRLDTIQGAILNVKLPYLNKWNQLRRKHVALYKKLLKSIKEVEIPLLTPNSQSVFHLFVIEVDQRDKLKKFLKEKGITTVIHYPIPIHLQEAYKKLGYKRGDFPKAENKAERILSLPLFPELKKEEIIYVVKTIARFFKLSY